MRTLRRTRAQLWVLCLGGVRSNLLALVREKAHPTETTPAKLWTLPREMDVHFGEIVGGTNAMMGGSWSAKLAEQVHAHTAAVKRYHDRYGVDTALFFETLI